MELGKRLVSPLHGNAGGALLVAGLHAHGNEFGLIQGGLDDDGVALLYGNTALGQQAGVITESCFFHNYCFLSGYFLQ